MGKGKKKVLTAAETQADTKGKDAKENHPKINGDGLRCGQMTLDGFLSPSKSRVPLRDAKLPPKHGTVRKEPQRTGKGRPDAFSGGDPAAPAEEEGGPCPPAVPYPPGDTAAEPDTASTCGTAGVPDTVGTRGTAEPRLNHAPAGTAPERGQRRRGKKPAQKTTENYSSQNRKCTDYYPIRRSSRKSRAELKSEEQQRIVDLIRTGAEEGLEVRLIDEKGRGVFASRTFRKGQFVVEYHGDLLETKDARKREEEYRRDPATGCYMYYFQYLNKTYCVDATKETHRLGRLVNHSKAGNCQTKLHGVDGKPHLILVASRDIERGEELLYDYGDRSQEAIAAHPWLKH